MATSQNEEGLSIAFGGEHLIVLLMFRERSFFVNFQEILLLCGGLALFLYGINIMSVSLEKISGGKLHQTLEKLTSNVFKSIFLGAVVAALTHSASATTVVVIGLVNAGVLKLRQSIGVIMGASIGTTVTSQILRLEGGIDENFFVNLLSLRALAPIFAVVGMLMFTFSKKQIYRNVAESLMGFSVLFFGMNFMEDSMLRLKEHPYINELFVALANPFLGILVGAIVTALLHSSAASVGILQALSASGHISYAAALPIIMGQNIGTCVTPIMAGFGTKINAKRASYVHLYFSVVGTFLFCAFIYIYQYFVGFSCWFQPIDKGGIANFHTLFNLVTTLIFLPFTWFLEKLTVWTIKDKSKKGKVADVQDDLLFLDDRLLFSPGLALMKCNEAVLTMASYVKKSFDQCVCLMSTGDENMIKDIKERELVIDRIDDKLSNYLLKLSSEALPEKDSLKISDIFHNLSEFERIGDHITNVTKSIENLNQNKIKLSELAVKELSIVSAAVSEILTKTIDVYQTGNIDLAYSVEPLEQVIDAMRSTIKRRHINRLKDGVCTIDGGIIFLDILSNLERISDRCSNIALYIIGRASDKEFNMHTYTKELHEGKWEDYNSKYISYTQKYYAEL